MNLSSQISPSPANDNSRLSRAKTLRWLGIAIFAGLVAAIGFYRGAAAALTTPASLSEGLVGYWNFDGPRDRIVDASGNHNDGVFINSTLTSGRNSHALKLLGRDDSHVSIPATPSLNNFTDKMTISAWVMPETPPDGFVVVASRQIKALKHPDQFYLGFGRLHGKTNYKWHMGTLVDGVEKEGSIYRGTAASHRWIYMAGVYDGEWMILYVDGVVIGRTRHTGPIQVDDNPLTIGAEENRSESHVVEGEFQGQIDEVRLYNRALSAREIKALWSRRPL